MTTPGGDVDATARVETDVRPVSRHRIGESQFAPGTIIAGRYRIASLLGSGGMGEVYRADDTKLDQAVALKFLPARFARDPILLGRLHDEVRLGRQIAHPNVCRIYDIVETDGGAHFVAMEYVDGEDLSKLLRRIGRLAHDKAVDIARGIAAGLMAAHAKGILHRDLKPANIMIDSRGDARVMDFGLALADDEDDGTVSGTPAYMAPEQFDGTPASVQSDLYALGLVMYELFTGKRAHNAHTMPERMRELSSEITTPSDLIRDLDPVVERIILRCTANDPEQRPRSAREVIHALPGGDPLAAAMAAGETPSPRIVAAAGTEGSLKPVVAWLLLGAIALLLVLVLMRGKGRPLQAWGLGTPPEVQQARAEETLRRLGVTEQPFRVTGLEEKEAYEAWVYVNDHSKTKWERFRRGLPRVTFWMREDPQPVLDLRPNAEILRPDRLGPPQTEPGASTIEIDRGGRLFSLQAIASPSWKARPLDWNPLLDAAGLRHASLTQTKPEQIPPTFGDTQITWIGKHPDDGTPIRVEAAAWHGVPVFFRILAPWDAKDVRAQMPFGGSGFSAFLAIVGIGVSILGAALAWRNLRLRRGDRQAAMRSGMTVFLLGVIVQVLSAQHEPVFQHEFAIYELALAWSLLTGLIFALLYLALEPYVRRRWPDRLISWARLVSGKWRDPMIGRDVLIGITAGALHAVVATNSTRLSALASGEPLLLFVGDLQFLAFPLGSFARFVDAVRSGIFVGMILMTLLMLLTIVLRRRWLAVAAFFTVIFTAYLFASDDIWILLPTLLLPAIYTLCVSRYGLLATMAMQLTFFTVFFSPLPDGFFWYTARGITPIVLIFALAIWSFFTSLGGQRAFAMNVLDD